MASKALIIAHNNEFNKAILNENALYFLCKEEVKTIIEATQKKNYKQRIENNYQAIENQFNWDIINKNYLDFINECLFKAPESK